MHGESRAVRVEHPTAAETAANDSQLTLGSPRANAILSLVDRIHRRMDFRFPPLRFEDFLASHDSYRVFEVELPVGMDGRVFLTPDGEQKTVHLRRENPRPRLRFTLAHEVIHAELHFHDGLLDRLTACRTSEHARAGRRTAMEREADFGAAALLMPLWMIERYLPYQSSRAYPERVVKDLARTFRVSEAAMRLQLGYYAAATR